MLNYIFGRLRNIEKKLLSVVCCLLTFFYLCVLHKIMSYDIKFSYSNFSG